MKKSLAVLSIVFLFFIFFTSAHANLINNGDFGNASQVILGNFSSSSGPYGVWLGTHGGSTTAPTDWWIVADLAGGKAIADYYAIHFVNTSKLYQGVEVNPTTLPIGSQLSFSFDYIYDSGFTGLYQSSVWLLGLIDSDPNVTPFFGGSSNVFPVGDVLYSATLTNFVAGWTNFSASNILVSENYDSIVVAFFGGAYGQTGVPGLRAIDNVSVNAAVPEPTTMLLLGLGLVGLAGIKRRMR